MFIKLDWAIVAHYFALVKLMGMWGWGSLNRRNPIVLPFKKDHREQGPSLFRRAVLPLRHGAIGTVFSEIFLFRAKRWQRLFKSYGWDLRNMSHNHLFYTGRSLVGEGLSFPMRNLLSRIRGSSCHIFVLGKKVKSDGV
jgi:hypothetical protein